MNEHTFAKKIVSKCRPHIGIAWKVNDTYAGGVPDALFVGSHICLWVEFKFTHTLPKRESTLVKPDLSKLQLSWMKKLIKNGQVAFVALGTPKKVILFTSIRDMENGIAKKDVCPITHNEFIEYIVNLCNP